MVEPDTFTVTLYRLEEYEFKTSFDWENVGTILLDEPEPLGHRHGPNAARLLAAAVGNCLSASLVFCLEKAHVEIRDLKTTVNGKLVRNERGRMRIGSLDVDIVVDLATDQYRRVNRCLQLFEDFCVVTASVRPGIEVNVRVLDQQGVALFREENVSK